MFQTEINVKLQEKQQEQYQITKQNAVKLFQPAIDDYKGRIAERKQEIAVKKEEHRVAELNFQLEFQGKGGSGGKGFGKYAEAQKVISDRIFIELKEIQKTKGLEIDELKIGLADASKKLKEAEDISQKTANSLNGLLERIKIAHEIAGIWITLFITLLFMAIELTPIFFKMMLIKSPYDFMSDNIKSLLKAEQGIEIKYDFYKDHEGVQRDLVINHQADHLMKEKIKLLQTQHELSVVVMENWKTKETKNIKDNPESYIEKNS
jgi:hypothetical protein